MKRALRTLCILGVLGGTSSRASADVRPTFDYDAPDGCPSSEVFEEGVLRRLGPNELGQGGTLSLSIAEATDAYRGELTLRRIVAPSTAPRVVGSRTLSAKDCDELVDAFVLVASLAWIASAPPIVPPPRPRKLTVSMGVDAGVYQGTSAGASFGGELFAEARYAFRRFVEPAVRLHLATAGATDDVANAGGASFVWITAGLDVCPARFAYRRFAFSPCARLDLGALRATGTVADTHLWVAPGALGRVTLLVRGRVSLEADAALVVPLVGSRYYFPPDATIFAVPHVAAAGRIGIDVQLY